MIDNDNLPHVLTPRETAKVLRCGKSTIYEQLRQNKISHVRLGRRILIPRASILKFLELGSEDEGAHPQQE